jgi:hypothetical protein
MYGLVDSWEYVFENSDQRVVQDFGLDPRFQHRRRSHRSIACQMRSAPWGVLALTASTPCMEVVNRAASLSSVSHHDQLAV